MREVNCPSIMECRVLVFGYDRMNLIGFFYWMGDFWGKWLILLNFRLDWRGLGSSIQQPKIMNYKYRQNYTPNKQKKQTKHSQNYTTQTKKQKLPRRVFILKNYTPTTHQPHPNQTKITHLKPDKTTYLLRKKRK